MGNKIRSGRLALPVPPDQALARHQKRMVAQRVARTLTMLNHHWDPQIKYMGQADLNVYCSLREGDGIGSLGVNFIRYCLKHNIKLNIYPHIYHNNVLRINEVPEDMRLAANQHCSKPALKTLFLAPPSFRGERIPEVYGFQGPKYGYFFWETDEIPEEWATAFNTMFSAVFVSSSYNQKNFSRKLRPPVKILPMGIDHVSRNFTNDGIFTVGFVGTVNYRKNLLGLIQAFQKAFPQENVRLKITCRFVEANYMDQIVPLLSDKRIKYESGQKSISDYNQWWDDIDCYCSLSRAEGFGKPSREALSKGIPVLVNEGHSEEDLVKAGVAKGIKVQGSVPGLYNFLGRTFGVFPDPSIDHAAQLLSEVSRGLYEDSMIQKGKEWVKQFNWEATGKEILNNIGGL